MSVNCAAVVACEIDVVDVKRGVKRVHVDVWYAAWAVNSVKVGKLNAADSRAAVTAAERCTAYRSDVHCPPT